MKIKINSNSREEKKNIAKTEMNNVAPETVKSAKNLTEDQPAQDAIDRVKELVEDFEAYDGNIDDINSFKTWLKDFCGFTRKGVLEILRVLKYINSYDLVESNTIRDEKSNKYWYFTKHGIQPGSVPKYVNIIDIQDTQNGSYFLTDGVIKTEDLKRYEIKEKKPEKIYSYTSFANDGEDGYIDTYQTIRFEYDGPAEIYEGKKGMEMYLEDDDQFKDDSDDVYKDSEYGIQFADAQAVSDAVDELIKDKIPQTPGIVNVHIVADLYFDIFNIYAENTDLGYDWQEERRVYDTQYSSDDLYTEFNKDKSKLIEFEIK